MPQIIVTDTEGKTQSIDIRPDITLMQAITEADVEDLLAICGGMCSCATCHVYIENGDTHELPAIQYDEEYLLSQSDHRQENSRLSCQIGLTEALDGLKVTVAPSED